MTGGPLREAIAAWHRACSRRHVIQGGDVHPVSWLAPAMLHAGPGHELVIILKTRGCAHHYSEDGGCTMCGYNNESTGRELDEAAILQQFDGAMDKHREGLTGNTPVVLKIFNSGSFFDDGEIPAGARVGIANRIAGHPAITELAIESRPEFITRERVAAFKEALPRTIAAETGIGLESWDDAIRMDLLHKGFDRDAFLLARDVLGASGMGTKVYIFVKPPFLSEAGALEDAWRTCREAIGLGVSTVSINPATIHAGTLLERLWNDHLYRPPWLYTIRVLLDRMFGLGARSPGTQVLCDPVAGGKPRGPRNCQDKLCNARSLAIIKQAVDTGRTFPSLDPRNDPGAECSCMLDWLDEMDW